MVVARRLSVSGLGRTRVWPTLVIRGCRRCGGTLYRDIEDYTCLQCGRAVPVEPYIWCLRCGGPLRAEDLECLLCRE
jgi:predicted amidophosphoribosyltransferase